MASDFNKPDELLRIEPHHVSFARFGDKWYSVGAIDGNGWVMRGEEPVNIEQMKAFYSANGGRMTTTQWRKPA